MIHRIVYAPSALDDIKAHVAYLRSEGVAEAVIEDWFDRLFQRVDDHAAFPRRAPIDPIQSTRRDRETRKLVFGAYLIYVQIDDEKHTVEVVAFTHGARPHPLI